MLRKYLGFFQSSFEFPAESTQRGRVSVGIPLKFTRAGGGRRRRGPPTASGLVHNGSRSLWQVDICERTALWTCIFGSLVIYLQQLVHYRLSTQVHWQTVPSQQ